MQKFFYQAVWAYRIQTKNADVVKKQQWKKRKFTEEAWIQAEAGEGSISPSPSYGKSDIWSDPESEPVNGKWEKVTSRRVTHPSLGEVVHVRWATPQRGLGRWLWWNSEVSHG